MATYFWRQIKNLRLKMFHSFYFLQSDMVSGVINLFSWIFSAASSEKGCPAAMPFLLAYIASVQYIFSRLLNSD